MNCARFRESLDCYLDRELAHDAMTAADRHRAECPGCDRLARDARELQAAVRRTVNAVEPPAGLDARILASIGPSPHRRSRWVASSAAAVLTLTAGLGLFHGRVGSEAANTMDRLALRLEDSREVVLDGTLLCRDCELEHRYGIQAPCKTIGHHGAIATPDGRIWNLVEQKAAAELIHNESLLGRRIIVHGRLFRGARALVIESYELQGQTAS